MFRVSDCVANRVRPAIAQPTEWQQIGPDRRRVCMWRVRTAKSIDCFADSALLKRDKRIGEYHSDRHILDLGG
jgi:hypothetical protein